MLKSMLDYRYLFMNKPCIHHCTFHFLKLPVIAIMLKIDMWKGLSVHLINTNFTAYRCTMPITAASVELRDDLEANPLSNQEPDRWLRPNRCLDETISDGVKWGIEFRSPNPVPSDWECLFPPKVKNIFNNCFIKSHQQGYLVDRVYDTSPIISLK